MKNSIGLLGGTFDPIHEGHLAIAKYVFDTFNLSRIEFIPSFTPAHRKAPFASSENRTTMISLAIKSHPAFLLNTIEIDRLGISYTCDTIASLKNQYPDNNYYFIIGADAFSQFSTWKNWEYILSSIHIVIVNRNNQFIHTPTIVSNFIAKNHLQSHLHFCTFTPVLISATQIRADIAAQKKKINGLPTLVHDYILEHAVY